MINLIPRNNRIVLIVLDAMSVSSSVVAVTRKSI